MGVGYGEAENGFCCSGKVSFCVFIIKPPGTEQIVYLLIIWIPSL